jgi:type II secretory pathway component GspD/PulD (secretin)
VKLDVRNGVKMIAKHVTHHYNRVSENNREHVVEILREKKNYYSKADKSNAVVIMNKEKYDERIQQLIYDGPYELMTSNPFVEAAKNMILEVVKTLNLLSYWRYKLNVLKKNYVTKYSKSQEKNKSLIIFLIAFVSPTNLRTAIVFYERESNGIQIR